MVNNQSPVETRTAQSFPITAPTKDFVTDERKPHDQSAGELSIGSSEVVYEEAKGVKTLASKFNELKQESLTSLASESMTSMTSTDTEKGSHVSTTVGQSHQHRRPILVTKNNSGNSFFERTW